MLRATSPPPSQFPRTSQPESPCKKQKTFADHDLFCSPIPGFGFRMDPDGCSTAAPTPMTAMSSSPWGTPWQGLPSPDWRTNSDSEQQGSWKRTAAATPGCSSTASTPMTGMHSMPWDAPWQDLTSPVWRTSQNCSQHRFSDGAGTAAQNACVNTAIPFGSDHAWAFDGLSTNDPMLGWFSDIVVTPPPEVIEEAWLEVASALTSKVELGTQPVVPVAAVGSPQSPLGTPRKSMNPREDGLKTAPGAPKKIAAEGTQMWHAIESDSISEVRKALADDPDAAWTPFWERDWEPPLCRAARRISDPAIVSLLLDHRADANAADREGQKPLALLHAAADAYPCRDLLPRSLFSEPSAESFLAGSQIRKERVQEIARILNQGGVITSDQPETPCKHQKTPDNLGQPHSLVPGSHVRPDQDVCSSAAPGPLRAMCPSPQDSPVQGLSLPDMRRSHVALERELAVSGIIIPPLQSPPGTPRKSMNLREDGLKTAPGAPKRLAAEGTQMWHAIESDSISEVRKALAEDPDAAWTPFWDCDWEPPLCRAARRISDPAIVSLLLDHRADANAADRNGQTPLALLHAADVYPCRDLLPRSLFSGPSVESFLAGSQIRKERAQEIARILNQGGVITSDQPETPCKQQKTLDNQEQVHSSVPGFGFPANHDGMSIAAPVPLIAMQSPLSGNPWQGLSLPETCRSHVKLESEPVAPVAAVGLPQSLPGTPRKSMNLSEDYLKTAPGAPKRIGTEGTQMWHAIESDSISEVRKALADDPDAAWTPFWECDWEPPLCRAARRISDPAIVSLLLDHRADVNTADRDGQTPLVLLHAAADVYPCRDLLPRSLFSEPSAESFPAGSQIRKERVQEIVRILSEAGATACAHLETPCNFPKTLDDLEQRHGPVPGFGFRANHDGNSIAAPCPPIAMQSSPRDTPKRVFSLPETHANCAALERKPVGPATIVGPPQSPPGTPRKSMNPREDDLKTAPVAPKKIAAEGTQMWHAIESDSISEVRMALADDPDAAWTPFWERDWEPPLCRAARRISDPAIVSLLLDHRADASAANRDSQTPLALLHAAADAYPCCDLLPRSLFSEPSVESFPAGSQIRKERVQEIARILSQACAIAFDQPETPCKQYKTLDNEEQCHGSVTGFGFHADQGGHGPLTLMRPSPQDNWQGLSLSDMRTSHVTLATKPVSPAAVVGQPQSLASTPRKSMNLHKDDLKTAPGAPKKIAAEGTQMWYAIESDSISEVRKALANDPDAAWTPIWDCDWEPPLCRAARRISDPAIVSLLLDHRADANAADRNGQTPLALLHAAADAYPCRDLLPRSLFSEPSAESFKASLQSRDERLQEIACILSQAGAIIEDYAL